MNSNNEAPGRFYCRGNLHEYEWSLVTSRPTLRECIAPRRTRSPTRQPPTIYSRPPTLFTSAVPTMRAPGSHGSVPKAHHVVVRRRRRRRGRLA